MKKKTPKAGDTGETTRITKDELNNLIRNNRSVVTYLGEHFCVCVCSYFLSNELKRSDVLLQEVDGFIYQNGML